MNRLARLLKGSRATAAVEFALFLPVFLVMIFGIVELGSAWYQKQMLVNASREGARLGSLLNDPSNSSAQVTATVTNYLQASGYPGAFQVVSTGTDGNPGDQVQVTVTSQYQLPVLARLVPGSLASVTLRGVTVMRHE
ncbi:MAG: pilus assembly protein [Desulfarculus sp.]|nr:pilus assembly protein [Desulfarculus sp.]